MGRQGLVWSNVSGNVQARLILSHITGDLADTRSRFECFPNQQTRALPEDATAFPWRGTDHFLMMTALPKSLDDRAEFEAHLDAWKSNFVHVSGYGQLRQYVNYGNTTTTVQDPPEALYGYEPWRLEKLRMLKRKYDPDNVFRWYQPLI